MIIKEMAEIKPEEFNEYSMITGLIDKKDNAEITMSHISIKPNTRVPAEGFGVHDFDEYAYILEGELVAQIEDESVVVRKGTFSYIQQGERHWSENLSDSECKLVCLNVKYKG